MGRAARRSPSPSSYAPAAAAVLAAVCGFHDGRYGSGVALRTALGGFLPLQVYDAAPFQRPEEDATFGFVIAPGW